jgi:hypothetical protein
MALVMEPTIKQMIADGLAPAPTEIQLRLTDGAALGAMLRAGEPPDDPHFA